MLAIILYAPPTSGITGRYMYNMMLIANDIPRINQKRLPKIGFNHVIIPHAFPEDFIS